MASLFLSYLLAVWVLLSQFPCETTAHSLKHPSRGLCSQLFDLFEANCKSKKQRDSNIYDEVPLRKGPLREIPITFTHREVEALKRLAEFIPEFPQELKAALSDSWSLLSDLQSQICFLKSLGSAMTFFDNA